MSIEKLSQEYLKATGTGVDIFKDPPGYEGSLIPLDQGQSLKQLVKAALQNIDRFDTAPRSPAASSGAVPQATTPRAKATEWLRRQPQAVQRLAKARPLNKLYRVTGGVVSETRGLAPLGLIVSYKKGYRGNPPLCGVQILGFKGTQLGSAANLMPIPGEGLEDVTDAARAGKLPELVG